MPTIRNRLLTTSALAAGGLAAAAGNAAEPIKLSLGGYVTTGITVRDQDNVATAAGADDRIYTTVNGVQTTTDLGRTDSFWEAEVFFVGETELDNGIKIGVNIQLEAYTSADQIDEHYVYVQGGFGRIVVGAENSAAYLMHYSAPSPTGGDFGADSPNFLPFRAPPSNGTGGSVFTFMGLTNDANKITYYTPRFAPGFQFGLSYTPDDDGPAGRQAGAAGCRGGCAFDAGNGISDNDQQNHHHFVEAGANFVRSINGIDLAFDVGFGTGFVLGMIAALLQWNGVGPFLAILAVYMVGQVLENYVLIPWLIGDRIGLHPLAVIFALLAFGTLFGFAGVLLALPASAALLVGLRHLRAAYRQSALYGEGPDEA